ncbi:hypothetical protein GpartN1_g232.t1 [Galdieria partita]|uniref:Glycosyltransferase 61 catalytic domain-containing protein n=1 Tax=Galdieria partita TaxID=83374 RepID=A0A9C7UMN5_9RHOD|nr:hypothetical protein GpartN1_g232.t1 [Galdieria partita]
MNRVNSHCREGDVVISSTGNDLSPVDTLRRRKTPTTLQVNRSTWKLRSFYLSLYSKRRTRGIFLVFIFLLVAYTLLLLKNGNLKLDFWTKDSSYATAKEPWSFEGAKTWFTETASLQKRPSYSIQQQKSWNTEQLEYEFVGNIEENKELPVPFIQLWKHVHYDITICRIFGVCVNSNRFHIFLNSSNMKKQLEYCGVKQHYYDSSGYEEWQKVMSTTDYPSYLDKDLVSNIPLRTHMPHFIEDITPFVAFKDILKGQRTTLHGLPFQEKYSSEGKAPVVDYRRSKYGFNPFFLFDSSGFHRFNGSWTKEFLTLLLGKVDLSPFVESIQSNTSMKCFRSVVTGKGSDIKYLLNHENSFFKDNNLRKEALKASDWCEKPIQVTILSRRANNARTLIGADNFAENIRKLQVTKDSKKQQKICHITFRCEIVYFEEMTFLEQISVMQKTDILIAAHGAGNTNIVFLPENSVVIEIYPFAYKANIFEELARKYLLRYDSLIAEPDTKSFKQCLQKIVRAHPELEVKVKRLTNEWDTAVTKFLEGDRSHKLKMENPKVSDLVPSSRVCARNQTLNIAWRDLCNVIKRQVIQML